MTLELVLRVAGLLLLVLAVAHVFIAKHFQWRQESERLSPFNAQMLLVHAFFIALVVGMMGALALVWPETLATPSALGKPVTAGLTVFWTIRLYFQWFVYDHSLWRGKRFETGMHLLFTAFWIFLIVLFGACLHRQIQGGL